MQSAHFYASKLEGCQVLVQRNEEQRVLPRELQKAIVSGAVLVTANLSRVAVAGFSAEEAPRSPQSDETLVCVIDSIPTVADPPSVTFTDESLPQFKTALQDAAYFYVKQLGMPAAPGASDFAKLNAEEIAQCNAAFSALIWLNKPHGDEAQAMPCMGARVYTILLKLSNRNQPCLHKHLESARPLWFQPTATGIHRHEGIILRLFENLTDNEEQYWSFTGRLEDSSSASSAADPVSSTDTLLHSSKTTSSDGLVDALPTTQTLSQSAAHDDDHSSKTTSSDGLVDALSTTPTLSQSAAHDDDHALPTTPTLSQSAAHDDDHSPKTASNADMHDVDRYNVIEGAHPVIMGYHSIQDTIHKRSLSEDEIKPIPYWETIVLSALKHELSIVDRYMAYKYRTLNHPTRVDLKLALAFEALLVERNRFHTELQNFLEGFDTSRLKTRSKERVVASNKHIDAVKRDQSHCHYVIGKSEVSRGISNSEVLAVNASYRSGMDAKVSDALVACAQELDVDSSYLCRQSAPAFCRKWLSGINEQTAISYMQFNHEKATNEISQESWLEDTAKKNHTMTEESLESLTSKPQTKTEKPRATTTEASNTLVVSRKTGTKNKSPRRSGRQQLTTMKTRNGQGTTRGWKQRGATTTETAVAPEILLYLQKHGAQRRDKLLDKSQMAGTVNTGTVTATGSSQRRPRSLNKTPLQAWTNCEGHVNSEVSRQQSDDKSPRAGTENAGTESRSPRRSRGRKSSTTVTMSPAVSPRKKPPAASGKYKTTSTSAGSIDDISLSGSQTLGSARVQRGIPSSCSARAWSLRHTGGQAIAQKIFAPTTRAPTTRTDRHGVTTSFPPWKLWSVL